LTVGLGGRPRWDSLLADFEPDAVAEENSTQGRFIEALNSSQNRLFAYLYAHVLNMADAEDLYQQVAIVLWEKFEQFVPGTDFGGWAIRVAELTIKNFLRGKRRSKIVLSAETMQRIAERQSQMSDDAVTARTAALQKCVKRLPPLDRELVERCYGGSHRIKEIAQHQGRSAGAVYTALCRIRQSLLACIERTVAAEARS
jgi:RNA polymerase sigma-70 factor (ECF subfamily)